MLPSMSVVKIQLHNKNVFTKFFLKISFLKISFFQKIIFFQNFPNLMERLSKFRKKVVPIWEKGLLNLVRNKKVVTIFFQSFQKLFFKIALDTSIRK